MLYFSVITFREFFSLKLHYWIAHIHRAQLNRAANDIALCCNLYTVWAWCVKCDLFLATPWFQKAEVACLSPFLWELLIWTMTFQSQATISHYSNYLARILMVKTDCEGAEHTMKGYISTDSPGSSWKAALEMCLLVGKTDRTSWFSVCDLANQSMKKSK